MEDVEVTEPSEVSNIDGEDLPYAIDVHARSQPRVVDLHALNVMSDKQRPPAVMDFLVVRQELEVPFDHLGQAICLGNAQAKTVLIDRAGTGVPELGQCLRSVAEPYSLFCQRANRNARTALSMAAY